MKVHFLHIPVLLMLACLALGPLLPLPGLAETTRKAEDPKQTLLDGIEKQYGHSSFSADFSQVSTLTALDMTESAAGQAWFSHPGKMKWRYTSPEPHEFITNGTTLWIYRPDENQVMIGDAAQFFKSGAGGAFLSDIHLMREKYAISLAAVENGWAELLLENRAEDPDIATIRIRVDTATHIIHDVTTINAYGDTTKLSFTHIEFKPLPEDRFEFSIPQGVNIIDMNE